MNNNRRNYIIAAVVGLLLLCCCCLFALAGLGAYAVQNGWLETPTPTATPVREADNGRGPTTPPLESANPPATPTAVPTPSPTPAPLPPTPTISPLVGLQPPVEIDQRPVPATAASSLPALWNIIMPNRDFYAIAVSLGDERDTGRTITAAPFAVGDTHTFTTDDKEVEATLLAVTEHTYFWVEDGVAVRKSELTAVADRFENELYPIVTGLFGREWSPGVDGDLHFSVLHLAETSADELGYFTSVDEYPASFYSDSNEQEIIYLNMSQLDLGDDLYYGTLVHEFQHLIHWHYDANETSWLDEGVAQLAERAADLNTFDVVDYIENPNMQFNVWDSEDTYPHYAAGALFAVYFWEQLGSAAVRDLVAHPADGLTGVRAILAQYQPERTLEQFVADWYVANYLRSDDISPRYDYEYSFRTPQADATVRSRPFDEVTTLAQYGVRYIDLPSAGEYTISFAGDTLVEMLAITPPSGQRAWLSPGADAVNATLTAPFDLTNLESATLEFWAWYELEKDYDYAYVMVSADDGQSWEALRPPGAARGDYGPAFNGLSSNASGQKGGWVFHSLALDAYAGQSILVRFQILTDSGIYERGFAVDDIAIPELGFLDDVETDTAVWDAAGFAAVATVIPQQWSVQLIEYGANGRVTSLPLDAFNQTQITVQLEDAATLVIAPMAPYTTTEATYWLHVE